MGSYDGGAACAEPMSGMDMALNSLETETNEIELAASNLIDRLGSVLMADNQPPEPIVDPGAKVPQMNSRTTTRVREAQERLNRVVSQLHKTMQRLDV